MSESGCLCELCALGLLEHMACVYAERSQMLFTRMTGVPSWMATDSLGKTGQQGEVVELLCM